MVKACNKFLKLHLYLTDKNSCVSRFMKQLTILMKQLDNYFEKCGRDPLNNFCESE